MPSTQQVVVRAGYRAVGRHHHSSPGAAKCQELLPALCSSQSVQGERPTYSQTVQKRNYVQTCTHEG